MSGDVAGADTASNAAALAAAAAIQAQLQARPDASQPAPSPAQSAATQPTDPAQGAANAIQLDAQAIANAEGTPTSPNQSTSRDALTATLAKLRGDAGTTANAATVTQTQSDAPSLSSSSLAAKASPFDRALADANSALAQSSAGSQSSAASAAVVAAQSDASTPAAQSRGTSDATPATLAAASAAAQATLQPSAAATAGTAANAGQHILAPHVGTADWTDALSQKVVFLSNAHQQSAELTLNPPDLGPLQVVLRVADNHAHALFVSQHAQVRDAVEAALPRLRGAMEAGGLGLGSTSVSDGGFASSHQSSQQSSPNGRRASAAIAAGDLTSTPDATAAVATTMRRAGLVDTFA